ncbi:MAG: PVC-type heme-binding CxxCH protein [Verrucomicrobiota bacterium]
MSIQIPGAFFRFLWTGLVAAWMSGISACAATEDPAIELASFQIADGFQVNLFASEKDGVVKPIQIRFDARGRLWVIGSTVYPQIEPGQTPDDKVLVLEDTDRDGRADKTTVFADGLHIPTGLELGHGGVYVGHGTELLFLRDTNGDNKADERRTLLRGFGTGDNHQNINSFHWGPGGELWMCQGLHIHSNVETPFGVVRLNQAGLWRLRPKLLRLEGFYGSAYEPQNPWGYVFTDWGEPVVIAGNNSSFIYPVPGLIVNHRPAPPPLIWKEGKGRKSSGGDIVGTSHFPEALQGALIVGGYINNAVWALQIREDGAGFSLEDLPPLLRSSSRNFRPVDAKFGPDGALYICDWYNPIIGHYQASFRHPDRDKTHGRIWRITAKNRPVTPMPNLAKASVPELLEALRSPDRWTRQFAKRTLADRAAEEVLTHVQSWIARPQRTERELCDALGVFQSHETVTVDLLTRLCQAADPGARAYAASVVGAWAERLPDPLALLRPLVIDEHPRVRLHAVVACTYVPTASAMEVAALAADFPTDKFLDYALNQAVFALKPFWLEPFRQGKFNLDLKLARLTLLVRADGTPDTLQAVRQLIDSPAVASAQRESFLKLLAEVGNASDWTRLLDPQTFIIGGTFDSRQQSRVLAQIHENARVRPHLRPANAAATLQRLWNQSEDASLRSAILNLAARWKVSELMPNAKAVLAPPHPSQELRIAAAIALSEIKGAENQEFLAALGRSASTAAERAPAAIGLSAINLQEAAILAANVFSIDSSAEHLPPLLAAFLQRQGGAAALTVALKEKLPTPTNARLALRHLAAAGRQDADLAGLFNLAAGFKAEPIQLTPEFIREFSQEVRASGNARRGAEIFQRPELGCVACHAVQGQGGAIGPDLSALGTAQPLDFIIGAIIDPQKEIKEGFMSTSVLTKEGEEYQGYAVRESAEEFVLRDVALNREIRLRRDQIKERKENGSVMPAGLADALAREEFRDLVRYLSELGKGALER